MNLEDPYLSTGTPDLNFAFLDAAKNGDINSVIDALLCGAHVNAVRRDGNTALHWAAKNNDRPMFDLLALDGEWVEKNEEYLAAFTPRYGNVEDVKAKLVQATKNIDKIALNSDGLLPSALVPDVKVFHRESYSEQDTLKLEFWEHCMSAQCRYCIKTGVDIYYVLNSQMPNLCMK
jgi:hypothetical protein